MKQRHAESEKVRDSQTENVRETETERDTERLKTQTDRQTDRQRAILGHKLFHGTIFLMRHQSSYNVGLGHQQFSPS